MDDGIYFQRRVIYPKMLTVWLTFFIVLLIRHEFVLCESTFSIFIQITEKSCKKSSWKIDRLITNKSQCKHNIIISQKYSS